MILPSDMELVSAAAATYAPGATPFFEDVDQAVRVFTSKSAAGVNIIAVEGTHDALGWAADFVALSVADQQGMNHATLGFIHAGFYTTALTALARCALVAAEGPYAICGHSLGAALALLIGAMLSQDVFEGRALTPVKIGAFAPPRVGGADFIKVATAVPFCAYRYGDDVVPEVPLSLPPLLPYVQVPLTALADTHKPGLGPFGCHHIDNYVAGVRALAPSASA